MPTYTKEQKTVINNVVHANDHYGTASPAMKKKLEKNPYHDHGPNGKGNHSEKAKSDMRTVGLIL